ncbi:hypothetical protein BDW59DRAFT_122255 [Aspergillus cavernicola]|uniref:Fungal STAND N-terminal Goodbye domain-containing protein n=1 Tax=Aspergillus cavernicola TaxID=176166 RepID=A0ABR4HV39_9EURO
MAIAYTMEGEWQKAPELDEKSAQQLSAKIEAVPEDRFIKAQLHTVLERMGTCYKQLGDLEKRDEIIDRAYGIVPYCNTCINVLVNHHWINNTHDAVIDLLRQLSDNLVPEKEHSLLTQALWDNPDADDKFFVCVADAALATDNLSFMVKPWQTATKAARKGLKTVTATLLELSLARIYSEFLNDQSKAVRRWEKIINTYASSNEATKIGIAQLEASSRLASQLLCEVADAGVGMPEAAVAGAKLEKLVKQRPVDSQSTIWAVDSACAMALGVYYRLNGQDVEALALFRSSIKRSLQILSDNDPENDFAGLIKLLSALLAAGDNKNVFCNCICAQPIPVREYR